MANLTKYDPFAELNALQRHFFGDDWFSHAKGLTIPTTDVYTNDDKELIIEAHLPNFEQKDVDIRLENGTLVIQAEKYEKEEDKKKKYVVRESASSFYRQVALPDRASPDKIEAHLEDGILKVVVPLQPLAEPKKITVKSKKK